jgi:hypothetical protein
MATTDLNTPPTTQVNGDWPPGGLSRAWGLAYAAIWAATLTFQLIALADGPALADLAHANAGLVLAPWHTPTPSITHMLALATVNLMRAGWPLLLGVEGVHRNRISRRIADIAVAVFIGWNTLWVGSAIGLHRGALLPYIPQLPIEWAAIAVGAAGWLCQRQRPLTRRQLAGCFAWTLGMVLAAAALETYGVPHQ